MSATVVVLAEYRERKASVQVTFDPFWMVRVWLAAWGVAR